MTTLQTKIMLSNVRPLAFALTGAFAVGCVVDSGTEPSDVSDDVESVAEAAEAISANTMTCSWGYYVCPDDGTVWDYAGLPACVDYCYAMGTKAWVANACNNYCTATCVVGGQWYSCEL